MAGQIFNIMRILQKNHYHHSNRTTGGSVNVYGGGSVQHRPSHTKLKVGVESRTALEGVYFPPQPTLYSPLQHHHYHTISPVQRNAVHDVTAVAPLSPWLDVATRL